MAIANQVASIHTHSERPFHNNNNKYLYKGNVKYNLINIYWPIGYWGNNHNIYKYNS